MLQTTILPNIQYSDVVPLVGIDEIVRGLSIVKTMLKASEDHINVSLTSQLQFTVDNPTGLVINNQYDMGKCP